MDENNFKVNRDLYGVGVAQDGAVVNQNIILPEHKVPPQLTSKLGKDTIIGREKELEDIDKLLNNSNSLLLINGIGGIGKSTIASYYLHSQKDNLNYYGFFEGIESFVSELKEPLDLKQEKQQDAFMEALAKLRKLEGEKLLVIDDVKNIEENQEHIERILELKNSGYKILMTSREDLKDVEQYYLDVLSMDDAKRLFNSIYEVEDEVLLEEILNYLDCHAFFVEMTAKTLKSKKTLTPELIKEKFENGEFSTIRRKRKESFNDYLNELFSFDGLDDEEILMLKQISVLPSIKIEFDFLGEIFNKKGDEEFEDLLNYLCDKGWLSSFGKSYKLHQIIKEYILFYQKPSFEHIDKSFTYFYEKTQNSANLNIAIANKNNLMFFESIYMILKQQNDISVALFYMNIGNIYRQLGIYNRAKFFGKLAIKIIHQIIKINNKNNIQLYLSNAYNNLSQTYYVLNSFQKTFVLDKKALSIREKILGYNHIATIQSYHNVAQLNFDCGNIAEAKNKFEKAIELIDKLNKIDNHDMYINEKTTLYSNYAIFLSITQNNHKLAKEYILKAITIYKKHYKNIDSNTATFYYHLAQIYENSQNYIEAKTFYEKTLQIKIDTFGEKHNEVATAYMGLSTFYIEFDLNKYCSLSIEYIRKALSIYKDIYKTDKHESIAICYDNLGTIYNRCKKYHDANIYSLKALPLFINLLGNSHYKTLQSYLNVTKSFYMIKKYIEALKYTQKIIELKPNCLNNNDKAMIKSLVKIISHDIKLSNKLAYKIGEIINSIKISN